VLLIGRYDLGLPSPLLDPTHREALVLLARPKGLQSPVPYLSAATAPVRLASTLFGRALETGNTVEPEGRDWKERVDRRETVD